MLSEITTGGISALSRGLRPSGRCHGRKADHIKSLRTYDGSVIKFRHRANKEITKVSYTTAAFIQAIKALGKENVTEQIIEHLKTYVNENQKAQMLEEAKPVTAWVYEINKKICK